MHRWIHGKPHDLIANKTNMCCVFSIKEGATCRGLSSSTKNDKHINYVKDYCEEIGVELVIHRGKILKAFLRNDFFRKIDLVGLFDCLID